MGLLSQLEKTTAGKFTISESRPALPCPACGSPRHWRDVYGSWHCAVCRTPHSPAQCREEFCVPKTAPEKNQPEEKKSAGEESENFCVPDFIQVIFDGDDSQPLYVRPGTDGQQVQQARAHLAWFARREAANTKR
jgi:ribosomal protein L37AE/L43A